MSASRPARAQRAATRAPAVDTLAPRAGTLRGRLARLTYSAGAAIHWRPREEALVRALTAAGAQGALLGARLIDVGCGLGQLATLAARQGYHYLGLDPDAAMLEYCRAHHAHADVAFAAASARDAAALTGADDLVVLNGVAHHLDDAELAAITASARRARGLIVLDHWRAPGATPRVTRFLQDHDRGRHVRDYAAFATLPGFRTLSSEVFPIGPLGVRLWLYFCNSYRPEGA